MQQQQQQQQQTVPSSGGDYADPSDRSSEEVRLTPPASPAAEAEAAGRGNRRRIWSKPALQRRQKLQDAQKRAEAQLRRKTRRQRLQRGWQATKKAINIGRWIDDLERDQELADRLEQINEEHRAEAERRQLVMEVREACMDAVRAHLESFLEEYPDSTYEDWVAELHPDNISEHDGSVDNRFYGRLFVTRLQLRYSEQ